MQRSLMKSQGQALTPGGLSATDWPPEQGSHASNFPCLPAQAFMATGRKPFPVAQPPTERDELLTCVLDSEPTCQPQHFENPISREAGRYLDARRGVPFGIRAPGMRPPSPHRKRFPPEGTREVSRVGGQGQREGALPPGQLRASQPRGSSTSDHVSSLLL